jgi:hypothetical protein
MVSATVDDTVDAVRAWLEDFLAAEATSVTRQRRAST